MRFEDIPNPNCPELRTTIQMKGLVPTGQSSSDQQDSLIK